jgi:hypothetical protein
MLPEMRASRPITIFFMPDLPVTQLPNADVNFTISGGVNPSPAAPPMVPRIPEIDFISVKTIVLSLPKLKYLTDSRFIYWLYLAQPQKLCYNI